MPVIGSCTDDYDDSAAWKDIDGIYKDLDQLKEKLNSLQLQANALSQIVKGGAITSVTEAANGGYVISYKGSDNIEHSFTIATTDQMVSDYRNTRRSRNILLDYYHQRSNDFPAGCQQTKNTGIR